MNLDRQASTDLAKGLVDQFSAPSPVETVVCPPNVYLDAVGDLLRETNIGLGAQNMYPADNGAFTGEISHSMLVDLGCRYVILGHSERRALMGETNAMVAEKVQSAFAAQLIPIVCVGETLEQREAGQTQTVVRSQLEGSLAGLELDSSDASQIQQLVLAYEPVWAIGTGKVASPQQAEEVHEDLRKWLENRYTSELSQKIRILYGGSVKPENAAQLLEQPNIDGALVGGASLDASCFKAIADAALQQSAKP